MINGRGDRFPVATMVIWIGGLTGWLRRRGVMPGTRVGIHLPRSAEAVALIAAVLAAGGLVRIVGPDRRL